MQGETSLLYRKRKLAPLGGPVFESEDLLQAPLAECAANVLAAGQTTGLVASEASWVTSLAAVVARREVRA